MSNDENWERIHRSHVVSHIRELLFSVRAIYNDVNNVIYDGTIVNYFYDKIVKDLAEIAKEYEVSPLDTNRLFNWFIDTLIETYVDGNNDPEEVCKLNELMVRFIEGEPVIVGMYNDMIDMLDDETLNKWYHHNKIEMK